MSPQRVIAATRNPAKLDLLIRLLDGVAVVQPFPADVPMPGDEDGDSFLAIAEEKARSCSAALGTDDLVVASDGGLLVPGLGDRWQPTLTRRFAGEHASDLERARRLLDMAAELDGAERTIGWREAVAVARGGRVIASWQVDGPDGLLARSVDADHVAAGNGFWVQAIWHASECGGRLISELSPAERAARRYYWDELADRMRQALPGFF